MGERPIRSARSGELRGAGRAARLSDHLGSATFPERSGESLTELLAVSLKFPDPGSSRFQAAKQGGVRGLLPLRGNCRRWRSWVPLAELPDLGAQVFL